jgi:hypothetical protein
MKFTDLTAEQGCVFDNASDEGNLQGLLNFWGVDPTDPNFAEAQSRLASAITALVQAGLVELFVYGDSDISTVVIHDAADALSDPYAWPGDDLPEIVYWTALTDAGRALLATATAEQLYSYRDRDG